MKFILVVATIITIQAFPGVGKLTGRWQSISKTGNVTGIVFKSDNTFEGYVNRNPFVTGTYTFENDVFSFVDNGCNGIRGNYKTIFYSNSDSLKLELIHDSCAEQKNGIANLVLGKVK